jgi:hypothetical protein
MAADFSSIQVEMGVGVIQMVLSGKMCRNDVMKLVSRS